MESPENISFKIGRWIEASASGRLAVILAFVLGALVIYATLFR